VSPEPTTSAFGSGSPSEPASEPGPSTGPETWRGSTQSGVPDASGVPSGYAQPGQQPAYPTPGSYPAGGYPTYGYGQPSPYPTAVAKKTNGLAVASLVCSIAGFLFFIPAVLGVVFGFVARSQIRHSSGTQGGDGLAVAGIIVGFAWIVLLIVVFAISGTTNTTNNSGVVLLHFAAGRLGT
jgi:hypothetical protein